MKLVIVGATGAVGSEMLGILRERGFRADDLVAVASPRSAGKKLSYGGDTLEVGPLDPEVFEGTTVALFDVPDDISAEWAPVAAERGAVVVDNSAAFRMEDGVPLVVPEVNPHDAMDRPRGIIASPNCTTLAMVVPVAALHRRAGLKRLILASYQAASGSGKPGVDELWDQTERLVKERDAVEQGFGRDVLAAGTTFTHPIAMNVIPQCGSLKEDGYTSEELKLCDESRKILGLPSLPVTATCVRVPVAVGHGVVIHAEFVKPLDAQEARRILDGAPGVEVRDEPAGAVYPTPLEAEGRDPCYVGRMRSDRFDPRALEMFCVADNLRKGAALNTVQIAELLLSG